MPLAVPLSRGLGCPATPRARPSRRSAMAVRACLAALVVAAARGATENFYVCNDVGDATFGGTYEIGDAFAGKPTWTNEFGKSLFAHGAWWYMGDLDAQPRLLGARAAAPVAVLLGGNIQILPSSSVASSRNSTIPVRSFGCPARTPAPLALLFNVGHYFPLIANMLLFQYILAHTHSVYNLEVKTWKKTLKLIHSDYQILENGVI